MDITKEIGCEKMDLNKELELKFEGYEKLSKFIKTFDINGDIYKFEQDYDYLVRKVREEELKEHLNHYDLKLRGDSKLQQHYINTGMFQGNMKSIDDICRTMYHSEFLAKVIKPDVSMDTTSLRNAGRTYIGDPESRHEYNANIEIEAVEAFIKMHNIPKTEDDDDDIIVAIKYIIANNPVKFDLKKKKVHANVRRYPWSNK